MDKIRISYNKEGGGGFKQMLYAIEDILTLFFLSQANALCDRGYTYTFFLEGMNFCPKEYAPMGISPSHANLFSVYPTLCNKVHEFRLDNLYTSAKLCAPFLRPP